MKKHISIVGAGLAGTECAYQLAKRGIQVTLVEQKPLTRTKAQQEDGPLMAELVCSNSFRSRTLTNAIGLLKEEMRRCNSLIISAAERASVPAGNALAVDRAIFSATVEHCIKNHPNIEIINKVITRIQQSQPLVIATGPLTDRELADELTELIGVDQLSYYDAIAPIVTGESIDWNHVFKASRYDKGGDEAYINCPFSKDEYMTFVQEIRNAKKMVPHDCEDLRFFEGCLPIEVMAERGLRTLAFGPMKPTGLIDPKTGTRPYAVVQLRQENRDATFWNMVGFQTRMTHSEQKRVFSMIPGLRKARFDRYGSIHRNTFVNSPKVLNQTLGIKCCNSIYLAGQITGVEGYVESAASGLVLGILLAANLKGAEICPPPPTTALGSLLGYVQREQNSFQPSNITWSMFPPLPDQGLGKQKRREIQKDRALNDLNSWIEEATQLFEKIE